MKLLAEDAGLFYKLNLALLSFTNKKLKLCPDVETPEAIKQLPLDEKVVIRNALWEGDDLTGAFLNENPFHFPGEEMGIVESWKHRVLGAVHSGQSSQKSLHLFEKRRTDCIRGSRFAG